MMTTTVRFTSDEWARLALLAERLGIPKAKLIHDATIVRIATIETIDQLAGAVIDRLVRERFGSLLQLLGRRVRRLEDRSR
jgi:predicted DNA-binding protein